MGTREESTGASRGQVEDGEGERVGQKAKLL